MEMFLTIKLCTYAKLFSIEQIIYIKMDFALNNQQRLICHETKTNQTKPATIDVNLYSIGYYLCLCVQNRPLFLSMGTE